METDAKLVKFPDGFIKAAESLSENHLWLNLFSILKNKKYIDISVEDISILYVDEKNHNKFWDIQFKFFLLRATQNKFLNTKLEQLYIYWHEDFPTNFNQKAKSIIGLLNKDSLSEYGKYYYPTSYFVNYLKSWNENRITLNAWKKYRYFLISKESSLIKLLNKDNFNFQVSHVRNLFNEYVDELLKQKLKPRIKNKLVLEKDKILLKRLILDNTASKEDKKDIAQMFELYSWRSLTADINQCLEDNLSLNEIDINVSGNLAKHMALIKYYEFISKSPQKKTPEHAMWFPQLNKKNNDETFGALEYLFEHLNKHCPSNSWRDFKSIFSKAGSTTKIDWKGDASILNYIFRTLHKHLKFEGKKWEVISFYFNPNKKETLLPKNLEGNSHYHDKELEKRINQLISTLS